MNNQIQIDVLKLLNQLGLKVTLINLNKIINQDIPKDRCCQEEGQISDLLLFSRQYHSTKKIA